ncbi:hypothetical protein ACJX0J_009531 [Zea mays]
MGRATSSSLLIILQISARILYDSKVDVIGIQVNTNEIYIGKTFMYEISDEFHFFFLWNLRWLYKEKLDVLVLSTVCTIFMQYFRGWHVSISFFSFIQSLLCGLFTGSHRVFVMLFKITSLDVWYAGIFLNHILLLPTGMAFQTS